jgi:hypothetical protein
MENTNKPQWLIDAEKDIQEFEESKYGKMKQSQLDSSSNIINRNKSEEARLKSSETGKVQGKLNGGKAFKKMWNENPDQFKESSIKGGITQGNINKEEKKGIFGQTKEQWSVNASIRSKNFWKTSSKEKLKNRADKCSASMKEVIEENGWWNPHQYITPELQKQMTLKQIETKLNQREERIKELYDVIESNDWFNIELSLIHI